MRSSREIRDNNATHYTATLSPNANYYGQTPSDSYPTVGGAAGIQSQVFYFSNITKF